MILADVAYPQDMTSSMSQATTDPTDTTLKQRYEEVKRRIEEAARRFGRRSDDIILVAVTKHASFDLIRDLIELGHVDLGENRVQHLVQRAVQVDEYLQRVHQLGPSTMDKIPESVRWHMIGNLQRNKVRKILPLTRLVHSVDSLRLAEEIQASACKRDEIIEVLIQVNASMEKNKHGIAPAAARHLIEQIDTMINIKVRGLMTMAPLEEDPREALPTFQRCKELFDDINKTGIVDEKFNLLSMGMSNDYEIAIECGANILRVGTSIFGPPETDTDSLNS